MKKLYLIGIVFLLLLSLGVSAYDDYYEYTNPLDGSTNANDWYGAKVNFYNITNDVSTIDIYKTSTDLYTGCKLFNATDDTLLNTGTLSSNKCTFTYSISNTTTTKYNLMFTKDISSNLQYSTVSESWSVYSNSNTFSIDERCISSDNGVTISCANVTTNNAGWYRIEVTYQSTTPIINDSSESTAVVKQIGTTSFVNPTSLINSDFNASINNTPLYGGYNFEVDTNNNNNIYCELEIDGVVVANETRSNVNGVKGNMFIQTPLLYLDNSTTHNQELTCERESGVGLITVGEIVGIGHFLVDEYNQVLNHNNISFTSTVTSGNNFTLLNSFNITTSNKTSDDKYNNIIIEGIVSYTNNDIGDEELAIYSSIGDFNCSTNPRDVYSGNTGITSIDCILENATADTEYVINIYGNGTNAEYRSNIIAKNFFISDEEIAGGTGVLLDYEFTGNTDIKIFNLTGGNLNHDLANVFQKLGYGIQTSVDTDVSFFVKIINGSTFTTKNFTRGFEAGKIGYLIGHDILEEIPEDPNYQIELWANCGTLGATCTIRGGSSLGYITDVTTTILNDFEVRVYDYNNDSQILNFTVTDGAIYSTDTGVVEFFTSNEIENLLIQSEGYINRTYLDHNTTNNLNVTLWQSQANITAYDKVSNNLITNYTLNISGDNYNDTNGSVLAYLQAGTHNYNISKTDYYSFTDSVTTTSLNTTQENALLYNHKLNISINDLSGKGDINIFGVSIYSDDYSFTEYLNTTSGNIIANLSHGNYTIYINDSYWALTDESIELNSSVNLTSVIVDVYTTNSVNINVYNSKTGLLVNDTTVDLEFSSDNFYSVNSTIDGTFYIDLLNPNDYTIKYSATDYETKFYYLTISDSSFTNLSLYLNNETTSDVTFTVYDERGNFLEEAIVKILSQVQGGNEFVTTTMGRTNTEGQVVLPLYLNTVLYKVIVEYEGEVVKITEQQPITTNEIEIVVDLGEDIIEDIITVFDVTSKISYSLGNETFNVTYIYNDANNEISQGCLYIYKINPNSETLVDSSCSLTATGIITLSINENTGVYVSRGYITYNSKDYKINEKSINLDIVRSLKGNEALFLGGLLVLVLLMGGALISIPLGFIAAGIGFISLYFLGIITLQVAVPVMVISVIVAIIVGAKK